MVQFLLLVNHPNNHIALAVNCYLSYCNLWSNNCNFLANCNFVCISHIHTLFTSINDEIGSPMDPLIFCFALLFVLNEPEWLTAKHCTGSQQPGIGPWS